MKEEKVVKTIGVGTIRIILIFPVLIGLFLFFGFANLVRIDLFSDRIVTGIVSEVIEPSGETQHYTYRIKYPVQNKQFSTTNGHKMDDSHKIGDKIELILGGSDDSDVVIKGYMGSAVLGAFGCALITFIFGSFLYSAFTQKAE